MATASRYTTLFDKHGDDVRQVFPDGAKKLLESSDDQPFVSAGVARKHAKDILAGLWRSPQHKVVLYPDGTLAAGHEYLRGIIEAGLPGKLYFEQGVEATAELKVVEPPKPAKQGDVRIAIETVTPELAELYLARNENRPLSDQGVAKWAKKMKDGLWEFNHEGIAFDDEGNLLDGQHRLRAIIATGMSFPFIVTRGLGKPAKFSMDSGRVRDIKDVFSSLAINNKKCSQSHAAAAVIMYAGVRTIGYHAFSKEHWINFILRYYEELDFAVQNLSAKTVRNAAFRGAVARAARTQDRERLVEFCQVLATGVMKESGDVAAVLLKNYYSEQNNRFGSQSGRCELFKRAQGAIQAFLARRELKLIRPIGVNIYPIAEDK